jgi:tetratricopeptide (TPR) repeat protein
MNKKKCFAMFKPLLVLFCLTTSLLAREGRDPLTMNEALRGATEGNYLAGLSASSNFDTAQASLYLRAAFRQEPQNSGLLEQALLASVADGAIDEAAILAEKLISVDKAHRVSRLVLAAKAAKIGQFKTARAHLLATDNAAKDLSSLLSMAYLYQGSGEKKEAVKSIEKLANTDIFGLFKHYHLGLLYDLQGEKAKAYTAFSAAYKMDSSLLRVTDSYARFVSQFKGKEEALAIYNAYEQVFPNQPIIREAKESLNAGFTLQSNVVSAQQGFAEVMFDLSLVLLQQKNRDIAVIYLHLARYLDPSHDLATLSLSELYEENKGYERAISLHKTLKSTSPLKAESDMRVGFNLEQLELKDEAKAHFEGLLAQKPNDLQLLQAYGNLLRARKDYAGAEKAYSQALEGVKTPTLAHWSLFYARGIARERNKDFKNGEKDFIQALALLPNTNSTARANVLNYLGYSWVDLNMNIDQGLDYIKQALDIKPKDGAITDSLGWAYYRLGRFEAAVTILERAVQLVGDDATLNDHLGDAYWQVGRKNEAVFQWNHARDAKPEPEDLSRILDKIQKGL